MMRQEQVVRDELAIDFVDHRHRVFAANGHESAIDARTKPNAGPPLVHNLRA